MPRRKADSGRGTGDPVWHALSAEACAERLGVDLRHGLSQEEAAARRARHGPNVIVARRGQPALLRFLLQFHAPLVYILLAAGAVTAVLGEYIDSAVIMGVVLVNAAIGFVQESKALSAIEALSRSMKMEATVRREGRRQRLEASELVPGDIVVLEGGDKVPADLRIVSCRELQTDESMLTGESAPVSKRAEALAAETVLADRRNMAYAGSLIPRGHGEGLVVATGNATEVGRISSLISAAEQLATPLTRKIASFSKVLLWVILAVAALAFGVGMLQGRSPGEMFMVSVALAVGAVPEGLPAAVTIMLAIGVSRMAARRAVIRKLPAVEALGSTTVICSDKTGTLTKNQMTVAAVWAGGEFIDVSGAGYDPAGEILGPGGAGAAATAALLETLRCGAMCNDASLFLADGEPARWSISGDPTEAALLVAARKAGLDPDEFGPDAARIDAIPFESEQQFMATLHGGEAGGGRTICVKGSVERVLGMCSHVMQRDGGRIELDARAAHSAAADLSGRGLRVLAFAMGRAPAGGADLTHEMVRQGLTFLGVQGMLDPPRPEAVEAVAQCRRAGIGVKMITGDHALTAATIASMIGIGDGEAAGGDGRGRPEAITGADMGGIADADLPDVAERTAVFARMTPEQKLRLVKALQGRGHIVAMTGDGVNDAPALRQADIGVAMGLSGSEVARDAADIVLADDNFASIEAAVEEGRNVYDNLTKFIAWTLPTNGGEAFVILTSVAIGGTLPILPLHALYVNMATGILMGVPLVFERKEPGLMLRPPRDPSRPVLTFELFMRTGLVSLLLCAGAMGVFEWELARGSSEAAARTAAVSVIVVGEMFYLFSARALLRPAWTVPVFSNMWLWAGIGAMAAVHAVFAQSPVANRVFHSSPLDGAAWAVVIACGAAIGVIVETEKAVRRLLGRGMRDGI